jgi:hypothetical protein
LSNSDPKKQIELKNVLIDGEFKVVLPDTALRPTGYVGNAKPDRDAERHLFSVTTRVLPERGPATISWTPPSSIAFC